MVEVSGLFTQSMNKEPLPGVQLIEAQHEKPGERDELAVYHHFSHLALTSSELHQKACIFNAQFPFSFNCLRTLAFQPPPIIASKGVKHYWRVFQSFRRN